MSRCLAFHQLALHDIVYRALFHAFLLDLFQCAVVLMMRMRVVLNASSGNRPA